MILAGHKVESWVFPGLTPGNYTFGTAPLTDMPPSFLVVPFIHGQNNNNGKGMIANRSTTGFSIIDTGVGSSPNMTVTIVKT